MSCLIQGFGSVTFSVENAKQLSGSLSQGKLHTLQIQNILSAGKIQPKEQCISFFVGLGKSDLVDYPKS